MMLSKEHIVTLLKTNDKAIARALTVLNANQTAEEQAMEQTRNRNGMGFRPCHARMGTSMAGFYQRNGYLSPKQLAYWRVRDASGAMRIGIYWKQLAEAAEAKKNAKLTADEKEYNFTVSDDLGDAMERRAYLLDIIESGRYNESDAVTKAIKAEVKMIEQKWSNKQ